LAVPPYSTEADNAEAGDFVSGAAGTFSAARRFGEEMRAITLSPGIANSARLDDVPEPGQVLPMNNRIDRQRQPRLADEMSNSTLRRLSSGKSGDTVAGGRIGVLEAELDVLKPGLGQFRQATGLESNARCDQVPIEPDFGCVADELDQIAPGKGLTPGEMHLQDTQVGSFAEDTLPGRGVEFGAGS